MARTMNSIAAIFEQTRLVLFKAVLFLVKGDAKAMQSYKDSISDQNVFLWYTYNDLQKAKMNLGLDLQGGMNVVMEAYPDLKANQNMMQLSEELTSTENRVAFARQAFNDAVTDYNSYKQSFPPVIFAASFGHAADAKLLEFSDSAAIQAAPKVSF